MGWCRYPRPSAASTASPSTVSSARWRRTCLRSVWCITGAGGPAVSMPPRSTSRRRRPVRHRPHLWRRHRLVEERHGGRGMRSRPPGKPGPSEPPSHDVDRRRDGGDAWPRCEPFCASSTSPGSSSCTADSPARRGAPPHPVPPSPKVGLDQPRVLAQLIGIAGNRHHPQVERHAVVGEVERPSAAARKFGAWS